MHSLALRAFVLAAFAASCAACSASVEPTDSTTDALIIHAPPAALTSLQQACGPQVTKGGCVLAIAYEVFGPYAGSSVTVTGYFEPGSVVSIDSVPIAVSAPSSDSNPTHIGFELPAASPGQHTFTIVCNGSAVKNEINDGPLLINYHAGYVARVRPSELEAGTAGTIDVTGRGLVPGMSINIGSRVVVLTDCSHYQGTSDCRGPAPAQPAGVYPVFLNTCPSTGQCYAQSAPLTYSVRCGARYVSHPDGSVFDVNTGKTWSYKGQDTQQYCLFDYGCASPSIEQLDAFFMSLGVSCASQLPLASFPAGKYWSNAATRTGEDTYTAMFFNASDGTTGSENGDDKHGCVCAQ